MPQITVNLKLEDAPAIVDVNKNINGTDYWPTIRIMIVKESLWIGSSIQAAVFVGVILTQNSHQHRQRQVEIKLIFLQMSSRIFSKLYPTLPQT